MNVVDALVPHRLTCDVPPGWHVRESLTLLQPGARANVILSSEPLEPGIDSATYAVAQGDLLRHEFPGYREHGFQPVPWPHDREAYLRRFQWHPPNGTTVEQLQVMWTEGARGYIATATVSTPELPAFESTLLAVLRSFRASGCMDGPVRVAGGPTPLTPTTPTATLTMLDWSHQVIDAGAVIVGFPLDPAATGRSQLVTIVQLRDSATFSITAQTTERHPSMDRWWDVVGLVNEWNSTRLWPTAFAVPRTENPHECEVILRHDTYLPGGATIDQLADLTDLVVGCAHDFWAWAHQERGL